MKQHFPSGHHILLDLHGVDANSLMDADTLQQLLISCAKQAGATVLHSHFHSFGPQSGITGVVLLAESHISIHTWPENQFAAVDIFMCGQSDSQRCQLLIEQALPAQEVVVKTQARGAI